MSSKGAQKVVDWCAQPAPETNFRL